MGGTPVKKALAIGLVWLGVICLVVGAALIYPPLGFIVAGADLCAMGLLLDYDGGRQRGQTTRQPPK
jgi:hypothetical protein